MPTTTPTDRRRHAGSASPVVYARAASAIHDVAGCRRAIAAGPAAPTSARPGHTAGDCEPVQVHQEQHVPCRTMRRRSYGPRCAHPVRRCGRIRDTAPGRRRTGPSARPVPGCRRSGVPARSAGPRRSARRSACCRLRLPAGRTPFSAEHQREVASGPRGPGDRVDAAYCDRPVVGCQQRGRHLDLVVFPAPFGPSRHTISPSWTRSESPFTTVRLRSPRPNERDTLSIDSTVDV